VLSKGGGGARFALVAAVVGVAVLTVSAPTAASPWFDVSFLYEPTSRTPGADSGAHVLVVYSDPGAPNQKPKVAREVRIVYPLGTRLDPSRRPRCHATDAQLRQQGRSACPANTQLGVGQVEVTSGVGPPMELDEATFNEPGGFIEVITLKGTNVVVAVEHERVHGRMATTKPPPSCIPPGQPPSCAPFGEFAVTRFEVFAPPNGIPVTRSTLVLPPTCPRSGFWTFQMRFRFADGSRARRLSYAPCVRKARGRPGRPGPGGAPGGGADDDDPARPTG
jgi:hypothetical protein